MNRDEVLQIVERHRQSGNETKAVELEQWLTRKEAAPIADQQRRANTNYGEDILQSIPGAFVRGNEYISKPFTYLADKASGGRYSELIGQGEEALFGDAAQYTPQTGPGRLASSVVEGASSAMVPILGQSGLAAKNLAPVVAPAIESGLAGLAGLSGQTVRETLPEQFPGRSAVSTIAELATPFGAAQLGRKIGGKAGLIPQGLKDKVKIKAPTPAGQQAAARKAFNDQFGSEQLLHNLENAGTVGGKKQTTALGSKNPEILAQQRQAVKSPDFDTKSIAAREAELNSKYIQVLNQSDVHTIPQAQRHVLNDLANFLDANTSPSAKARSYKHGLVKKFYESNKADIDAVPQLKELFNQPNTLKLKSAIDSDLGDFSALSKMGLKDSLSEVDVWSSGNPFPQLKSLLERAGTPRERTAVVRQVHKALTSRIFGDTRDLGNMDDEFIQKSYKKLVDIWNGPGGVEALREIYNSDQMLVLHSVVDHMTRTGLRPAQGISLPSTPNQALKDVAGLWTMRQLNKIYGLFGQKSMAGGLKVGSIGSRVANEQINKLTVGPFNAEYVRILDDPEYASRIVKEALGKSVYTGLKDSAKALANEAKGIKGPGLSIGPASTGVGRFAPGLTPTGTFEYEEPNPF